MVKSGHAYRFVALSRQYGLKLVTSSDIPKGRCTMVVHTDDVDKVKKLIGGDVINRSLEAASKVMTMYSLINVAVQSVVVGTFFLARGPKAAYKEVSDRIFPNPPSIRVEMAETVIRRTEAILGRMRAEGKAGGRIKARKDDDDGGGGSDGGPDGGSDGGADGGADGDYQSYLDVMEKIFDFHSSCFTDAAALRGLLKLYEGIPLHFDKIKTMVVLDAFKVMKLQQDNKYHLLNHLSKEGGWNHYATIKFAGVGEHTDLYREMIETGLIKLNDQQADNNSALVYGLINELVGARARVGLTGLTVADHIREVKWQDVLCFIGHFFHFTKANSEVSSLLGPMLSATTFSHLDVVTVLSHQISELGIYAAVDPLGSTARMLSPHTLGEDLYNTARGVQKVLKKYKIQGILVAILGMNGLSEDDKLTVACARETQRFLSQPFHVAERVSDGKYVDLPELSFYMVGGIEEVIAKAEIIAEESTGTHLMTELAYSSLIGKGL